MLRRSCRLLLVGLVGASVAACGKDAPDAQTAADVEVGRPVTTTGPGAPVLPPAPPARDALDLAVRLVGARAGILFHVEPWRGHSALREITGWMPLRGPLERAGIDPTKDVDRLLLAAPDAREWNGAGVYEHHIDAARLQRFMEEALLESSPPGERLQDRRMTGFRVHLPVRYRGGESTFGGDVWMPTPTLIVVVPIGTPLKGLPFASSGGLPLPKKGEGGSAWALEPSDALENRHVAIPKTLSRADAWISPRPGGAVHAEVRALSSSPDQAMSDANAVTGALVRATSVRFGPLTVRVFQTPVFRAEGEEVVGEVDVTRMQLEQLLAVAGGARPKY